MYIINYIKNNNNITKLYVNKSRNISQQLLLITFLAVVLLVSIKYVGDLNFRTIANVNSVITLIKWLQVWFAQIDSFAIIMITTEIT